jgi:hypothetical protein
MQQIRNYAPSSCCNLTCDFRIRCMTRATNPRTRQWYAIQAICFFDTDSTEWFFVGFPLPMGCYTKPKRQRGTAANLANASG